MKLNLILLMLALTLITACSGGEGSASGGGGGTTVNGTLVDSEIQGVYFESDSYSGLTNSAGAYQCKTGETLDFSLNGGNGSSIYLGSVSCRTVVSPVEIVTQGQFTVENSLSDLTVAQRQAVKNVLRLMQTLDSDSTAAGIQVSASEVEVLAALLVSYGADPEEDGLEILLDIDETDMSIKLNELVSDLNTELGVTRTPVSEATATAHFEATQDRCSASGCDDDTTGGTTGGTDGGTTQASIVKCMSGVTMGNTVTVGSGLEGDTTYPVNTVTGALANGTTPGKYETLIVLRSDSSAQVYRRKAPNSSTSAWYSFSTTGWQQNTLESGDADTYLVVQGVTYSSGMTNLKFEEEFVPGVQHGLVSHFGADIAAKTYTYTFSWNANDRQFSFLDVNSCPVPSTATAVTVESQGF